MKNKTRRDTNEVSNNDRETVNIFGTILASTTKEQVLKQVEQNIEKDKKFIVLTPNPEIVLKTRDNQQLQDIVNGVEITIADGVGIKLAYSYLSDIPYDIHDPRRYLMEIGILVKHLSNIYKADNTEKPFPVIKGRELFPEIVKLCKDNNWKVYLLGGIEGVAKKTSEKLKRENSGLSIKYNTGPELDEKGKPINKKNEEIEKKVVKKINDFGPAMIFVAFGAPKQEIWCSRYLSKLNTNGMMVVGGAFDYIGGKKSLPPALFSGRGLEWLWRLITQPERIGRIINAVIVFPIRLYLFKLNNLQKINER